MKWLQNGNLAKLVAFFVIATVLSCTVSFAANGWQSFVDDSTNSDKVVSDSNSNIKNEANDTLANAPEASPIQKYYHGITGLPIDNEKEIARPLCFVFSSSDPLYGIFSSYLTIEIPTEYGNTRLLCFTDDAKTLGKIGSISPSRGYISNFASYFGGILLSYGTDDNIEYAHMPIEECLDFSKVPGYCYSEYNSFIYTNADLVNAFMNNSKVATSQVDRVSLPYAFPKYGNKTELNGNSGNEVLISYSDSNSTMISYSATEECYYFSKNNGLKNDLLNDKPIKYDNVFIIYSDSTTYESESTTQLVMDTYTKGSGLYMYGGVYVEMTWERCDDGSLAFYDANGDKLTVNRGTSYMAVVKSSAKGSVTVT